MKKFIAVAVIALTPAVAAAQLGQSIGSLLSLVSNTLGALVYIVMSLGLLTFLWGVVKYVISNSDDDKKNARQYMIWGIIGLTVIFGVWGFVSLVSKLLGSDVAVPQLGS